MNSKNNEKAELGNWDELGFQYIETGCHFVANFKNGKWDNGDFVSDPNVMIHQGSTCLHYAQQCFEGMKAYENKEGNIMLFRPELNWERMTQTAQKIMIASPPKELFLTAIEETVRRNWSYLPPYTSNASLYIRPVLMGCGKNLGLKPADECQFRVFVSPVSDYFAGKTSKLIVAEEDRTAPLGIGNYKAGANYAAGFAISAKAREQGGTEALYLDALHHQFLDEAGSANVIVLFPNDILATPSSSTILPSITRRSVMKIAEKELGLKIQNRNISVSELFHAKEVGLTGTAVIITAVGEIVHGEQSYRFYDDGKSWGPVMTELKKILLEIQKGDRKDEFGWAVEVKR